MKTEKNQHVDNPDYGYWRCPIHGTGLQCCEKSKWIEAPEEELKKQFGVD